MEKIIAKYAPKAAGPYSHAIKQGNFIFTSGQVAIDPKTGELIKGGIEEQTKRTVENIEIILKSCNSSLENVIKANVYLKDMNDFHKFNEIYAKYMPHHPARTTIGVAKLPKDALIEIDVIAK